MIQNEQRQTHSHHRRSSSQRDLHALDTAIMNNANSSRIVSLEEPRSELLRSRNVYVEVTKLPNDRRRHSNYQTTLFRSGFIRHEPRIRELSRTISDRTDNVIRRADYSRECHSDSGEPLFSKRSAIGAGHGIDSDRSSRSSVFGSSVSQPGRAVRVVVPTKHDSNTDSKMVDSHIFSPVICQQPRSSHRRLDPASSRIPKDNTLALPSSALLDSSKSIICQSCGRCRCSACTRPRYLPSRMLFGSRRCLLSSQCVVDTMSCMCCVKACLYHTTGHVYDDCSADDFYDNGVTCNCDTSSLTSDRGLCHTHNLWSCSSESTDRCFRWTTLVSALCLLPCLWLYLPLKACAAGVEMAYRNHYDNGCRCGRKEKSNLRNTRRRFRTLPPELPSVQAAKRATVLVESSTSRSGLKNSIVK